MKKQKNEIEYSLKGNLESFEKDVMLAVTSGKNPKVDNINLKEMYESLQIFATSATGRDVELKLVARVIDSEDNDSEESDEE